MKNFIIIQQYQQSNVFWIISIIIIQYMSRVVQRKNKDILLSAAIASFFSTLITNPIQVAKLNRQYLVTTCPSYPHQSYQQLSICSCSKFDISNSFKGIKVAIPQVLFSNLTYMQLYEKQRQFFYQKMNHNSHTATLIASLSSRLVVTTLMIPFQSLRVRMGNLVQNQTLSGTKGLKITLLRDLIFSGLFWSALEYSRNHFAGGQYRYRTGQISSSNMFLSNIIPGLFVGMLISAITTPLDTIKTRIQSKHINLPIWKTLKQVYRTQGLPGLFSGVTYRVLKNGIHTTLYLTLYEFAMRKSQNFQ